MTSFKVTLCIFLKLSLDVLGRILKNSLKIYTFVHDFPHLIVIEKFQNLNLPQEIQPKISSIS